MRDKSKIQEALNQYEDGAITYGEFVNYCLTCVTDEDREAYKEVYKSDCPY
jgi:hypothetical protein